MPEGIQWGFTEETESLMHLGQGSSASAWLAFGVRCSLFGGCPVRCRMLSGIPSFTGNTHPANF